MGNDNSSNSHIYATVLQIAPALLKTLPIAFLDNCFLAASGICELSISWWVQGIEILFELMKSEYPNIPAEAAKVFH